MATNYQVAPLSSAARTATTVSPKMTNRRHTGVLVTLSVTAASGTGGLTLSIRGYDPQSGNPIVMLLDGAAITATGTFGFLMQGSAGAAANGVRIAASRALPAEWDISIAHGDSSSYTYSVSATLLK